MTRGLFVLYGGIAYLIFFATFLYLIEFLCNLPLLPLTIDRGPEASATIAFVTDAALIALFGVQHSVMARPGFKRAWTRIVPQPIERSTYVLVTSAVLILLFVAWRPLPASIWHVDNRVGIYALWAIFGLGWGIVLLSTFLINHFELFGLKQVWLSLTGKSGTAPKLRRPFFYKLVRHPLYSGFLLAFWATPAMSLGHLIFALGMSAYILIAIQFEERDLVDVFGSDYEIYQREVGMLAPGIGKRG